MIRTWGFAPSIDDVAAMADRALDLLPEPFREFAKAISIRIEDIAEDQTLVDLEIENPYDLTGLYSGTPLTEDLVSEPSREPPRIFLYRLAILDEWVASDGVTLEELVAHVLIHELAHHFGWTDEDIDRVLDAET
jgi:predicted Zn-dependent protease with MMP-like domain